MWRNTGSKRIFGQFGADSLIHSQLLRYGTVQSSNRLFCGDSNNQSYFDTKNDFYQFQLSNSRSLTSNPLSKYWHPILSQKYNYNEKLIYFQTNFRQFGTNSDSSNNTTGGNVQMMKKPQKSGNKNNKNNKQSPKASSSSSNSTIANMNKNEDLPPEYHGLRRKRTSHPKASSEDSGSVNADGSTTNEYEDLDEEYIPEMDWDHTRFHDHYDRIWEEQKEPPTLKEKFYNLLLRLSSMTAIGIAIGSVIFGAFIYVKMRGQLRHVNKTQKLMRKTRKIFELHPNMIPLDISTMDVSEIKNELMSLADENGKISLDTLKEKSNIWKELMANDVDINRIADWQENGIVSVEDTTYVLALLQYFLSQSRRKGTPSVRRELRDDMYKMICSYDGNDRVTLKNMGSFGNACFCLAILSPPNLGYEEIGGQNLDEFKVNYVRYMLRDKELTLDAEVPLRRFNFLYKVCDFSIGLTPESQGQLAK